MAAKPKKFGRHPGGLLFDLPSELRLQIYELIFPQDSIELFAYQDRLLKPRDREIPAGKSVAILATCSLIYDEARPVLYQNTHFDISCSLQCRPLLGRQLTMADVVTSGCPWTTIAVIDRSFRVQEVRNLTLNILLTADASPEVWEKTWLHQLPTKIESLAYLQNLHIRLRTDIIDRASVQEQADHIMVLLARLKCKGRITATMSLSLRNLGFKPGSYYTMLSKEAGRVLVSHNNLTITN